MSYGVTAIGVGLGTIITAGGKAGVNDGTIRLAILVFGATATLTLVGAIFLAWRNDQDEHEGDGGPASGKDDDSEHGGPDTRPPARPLRRS